MANKPAKSSDFDSVSNPEERELLQKAAEEHRLTTEYSHSHAKAKAPSIEESVRLYRERLAEEKFQTEIDQKIRAAQRPKPASAKHTAQDTAQPAAVTAPQPQGDKSSSSQKQNQLNPAPSQTITHALPATPSWYLAKNDPLRLIDTQNATLSKWLDTAQEKMQANSTDTKLKKTCEFINALGNNSNSKVREQHAAAMRDGSLSNSQRNLKECSFEEVKNYAQKIDIKAISNGKPIAPEVTKGDWKVSFAHPIQKMVLNDLWNEAEKAYLYAKPTDSKKGDMAKTLQLINDIAGISNPEKRQEKLGEILAATGKQKMAGPTEFQGALSVSANVTLADLEKYAKMSEQEKKNNLQNATQARRNDDVEKLNDKLVHSSSNEFSDADKSKMTAQLNTLKYDLKSPMPKDLSQLQEQAKDRVLETKGAAPAGLFSNNMAAQGNQPQGPQINHF